MDRNLENLTAEHVDLFLCTFNESCNDKAEYEEFSNEVLYKVLDKNPGLLVQQIAKKGNIVYLKNIIYEIENPVHDGFDFQKIKDGLSHVNGHRRVKKRIINAVDKAISAYN